MKSINPQTREPAPSPSRLGWIMGIGCLLLLLIITLRPRSGQNSSASTDVTSPRNSATPMPVTHSGRGHGVMRTPHDSPLPGRPAEEVVAEKLSQFVRNREELVAAMAKHYNVAVTAEVSRFFAAAQAGPWEETTNLFASLRQLHMSNDREPGLEKLWPAIVETYGVAEAAHLWPSQKLLDYGNAILESLRPGMIYLGGNDAGRFIPTLLGDTSEGEPHIILTQNALADGSYLEYIRFRYGDKLQTLSGEDSQRSFQNYLADAQKRLQHDQDFPNEPRQIRPGEDIRVTEGRVQVSGQVAVMGINELLLQTLLQKNPDLSFALEESFPLQSFYGEATTLGPITELRAGASTLTPERAAQSIDYWRSTTETLLSDTDAGSTPREAYAKMILGQGALFQNRELTTAAEQAYQLATSLSPANPEAVFRYVHLLTGQKRHDEARQIVQTAITAAPDNQQFRDVLTSLNQTR